MIKSLLKIDGILKFFILVLLVIFIITSCLVFKKYWDINLLHYHIKAFGLWAPIVFLLLYMLSTVSLLPAACMSFIGGYIFGFYHGLVLNIIGSALGVSMAFFIGRYLTTDLIKGYLGNKSNAFIANVEKFGWRLIAIFRLTPLVPFDILNFAFGITNIKISQYLCFSTFFMLPGLITYTYLGNLGLELFIGEPRLVALKSLLGLFIGVVLLLVLPKILASIRQKLALEELESSISSLN